MKRLIDLSTKKLELLKKDGDAEEILALDIAFNKAYEEFLKMNQVQALEAVDQSKYRSELKYLKSIVTKIYTIEMNNAKNTTVQKNNNRKKKITNLYKKNMK